MKAHGKTFSDAQLQMIVNAPMCENAAFLRTLLGELAVFGNFEHLESRIKHYLTAQSLTDLMRLLVDRWEKDYPGPERKTVSTILQLAIRSKDGLTEQEILELTSITQAYWSPVRLALQDVLVFRYDC
jgi:hypothetical protein